MAGSAQDAHSQAWLDRRLAGLAGVQDFEGHISILCTAALRPPQAFQDHWVSLGPGWQPGAQPILTEEDAPDLRAILVFCNQNNEAEVERLSAIVRNIDAMGIDAPPLFWVPHSVSPEDRVENYSDLVTNEMVQQLLQIGLDGVVYGEPEGVGLALSIRSRIHRSEFLSQSLQDMIGEVQAHAQQAAHLQECMQNTLWDYVRTRIAPEIPPMDGDIPPGEVKLPGFSLEGKLGQGAFGSVYKLKDEVNGNAPPQVVKAVSKEGIHHIQDMKYMSRMIHVMNLLSQDEWRHPNLVVLHETYHTPTHILFRLEYGGPENLYRRLSHRQAPETSERHRPLPLEKVMAVMRQMTAVVAHLHVVVQMCHRDVKPENLIVTESPDHIHVKLADFDVAIILENNGAICRSVCGTLPFVAPEVLLDTQYDGSAADMWSLGVVLLELLCGVRVVEQATGTIGQDAGSREDRVRVIQEYFKAQNAAGALLQERCRPELRVLLPVCTPLLNGMLEVDALQRVDADEVRVVLQQSFGSA